MNQHLHWLKGEQHAKATHDGTFDHILQSSPTKQNKKNKWMSGRQEKWLV